MIFIYPLNCPNVGRPYVESLDKVSFCSLFWEKGTLPETNIPAENWWQRKTFLSFWGKRPIFGGEKVSFREGNSLFASFPFKEIPSTCFFSDLVELRSKSSTRSIRDIPSSWRSVRFLLLEVCLREGQDTKGHPQKTIDPDLPVTNAIKISAIWEVVYYWLVNQSPLEIRPY